MGNPDIPSIRCIVGSTCLSADLIVFFEFSAETKRSTTGFLDTALQHVHHLICSSFIEGLFCAWNKVLDDVSVFVFNACDVVGFDLDSEVDERTICSDHFIQRNVAGSQAD